jgi:hypothetical protein
MPVPKPEAYEASDSVVYDAPRGHHFDGSREGALLDIEGVTGATVGMKSATIRFNRAQTTADAVKRAADPIMHGMVQPDRKP